MKFFQKFWEGIQAVKSFKGFSFLCYMFCIFIIKLSVNFTFCGVIFMPLCPPPHTGGPFYVYFIHDHMNPFWLWWRCGFYLNYTFSDVVQRSIKLVSGLPLPFSGIQNLSWRPLSAAVNNPSDVRNNRMTAVSCRIQESRSLK